MFGKRGRRPPARARRESQEVHPAVAANTKAEVEMRIKNPTFIGDAK
ncbi:MAG: hypothetical protein ACXU9A_20105 [Xanthobacteraceae bacterium]